MDPLFAEFIGFILTIVAVLMAVSALLKALAKQVPAPAMPKKREKIAKEHKMNKRVDKPQVQPEAPPVEVTKLKPEPKRVRGKGMIIHHEILSPPLALRKK